MSTWSPRSDGGARAPIVTWARALQALGRPREAVAFAHRAYRQTWGEGRPYRCHRELIEAEALLADLDEEAPDLPDTDMGALRVPLEQEILALIAKERGSDDRAAAASDPVWVGLVPIWAYRSDIALDYR
jgi:hypothetical protein